MTIRKKKILLTGIIITLILTGCKKNTQVDESLSIEEVTKSYEDLIETESLESITKSESAFETQVSTSETINNEPPSSLVDISEIELSTIQPSSESKDEVITIDVFEEIRNYLDSYRIDDNDTEEGLEEENIIEDIKEGFHSNVEEIKELINSDEVETAKEVGKEYVTKFIDFLFYGEEIDGVTIDDCSDIVKQDIYDYFRDLDKVLMLIDPEYKEDLGIQYEAIKELSIDGYNAAKEYIIEQVGQDKYDEFNSKKDEVLESAAEDVSSYVDRFLNFLDDKYQEWKESDNKTNKKYIFKR